jgi:hypothetical protein
MIFDPKLTVWENLDNMNKTAFPLIIIFTVLLLIIHIREYFKKEKSEEMSRLIGWGYVVVVAFMAVTLITQPFIKRFMDTAAEESAGASALTEYESLISKEDCRLCGEKQNELFSWYLDENNIAVLDLNTFDFYRLEINRYDDDKNLIEKSAGFMQIGHSSFNNSASLYFRTDPDRGYADGTVTLNENCVLSLEKTAAYLCPDCLTELINKYTCGGKHWNIAPLNLQGKTIQPLEESITGFGMGDFSVKSRYDKDNMKIELLIWYSPVRYETK